MTAPETPHPALQAALTLPAVLDLSAAEALHQSLLEAASRDPLLTLDGTLVERVSTACLQILLAAVKYQHARGGALRWAAISEPLKDAAKLCGVADFLFAEELTCQSP